MSVYRTFVSALFVLALTLGGVTAVAAQDATPTGPSEGYPVAIHEGTCDDPTAEPAWQVDPAVTVGVDQDDPEIIGTSVTSNVSTSSSAIDVSLDDLGGSDHIVAIHASSEEFGTLVACGQVAGVKDDEKLVVALTPVGDSGVYGIAILDEDEAGFFDLGEDQTQLTVYVIPPTDDSAATPVA